MKSRLSNKKKHILSLILVLFFNTNDSFSQTSIVFVNRENGQPIYGVSLFDCDKKLRAISNEKGAVDVSDLCYPLFAKQYEFKDTEINKQEDTVYLSFKYKDLSDITVKPVKKVDLYNHIINSSSEAVKKNQGVRFGNFFQSLMIVNETKGDTSYIYRSCSLAIETENNKKSKEYSLYYENAIQSYIPFKKCVFDTSATNGMLNVLPSFESNFSFDLMNIKKYKLKFEEDEISYINSELRGLKFHRNDSSSKQEYSVYFDDSILFYWNSDFSLDRPFDGQNMFMNMDHTVRTYSFDSSRYELSGILNKTELTFFTQGSLFRIYMVQGFEEEAGIQFELSNKVQNLKKHFESLPYSDSSPKYYLFE